MAKKLISILFLLLIAGAIFIYLNFDILAKRAAEKIASDALGVKVRISSLDISLEDKKVEVDGLRIFNPPGYQMRYAMSAQKITISLNNASKELIDFKRIIVENSVVNLEINEKGNNLSDLKKLAARKSQKKAVGSKQVRVIVRKMLIGSSTLNPSVTLVGSSLGHVKIPPVQLVGVGRREGGILAREAIIQVITAYMSAAEKSAGSAGLLKGASDIEKAVDQTKKDFKKLGKNIGEIFGR